MACLQCDSQLAFHASGGLHVRANQKPTIFPWPVRSSSVIDDIDSLLQHPIRNKFWKLRDSLQAVLDSCRQQSNGVHRSASMTKMRGRIWAGTPEQVTLCFVSTQFPYQRQLLLVFYAFNDDLHMQVTG